LPEEVSYKVVGTHRGKSKYECSRCGTRFFVTASGQSRAVAPVIKQVTIVPTPDLGLEGLSQVIDTDGMQANAQVSNAVAKSAAPRKRQRRAKPVEERFPTTEAEVLDLYKQVGWVYPREAVKFEWQPPAPDVDEKPRSKWRRSLKETATLFKYFRVVYEAGAPAPATPGKAFRPADELRDLKPPEPDAI
jgi:hypothetical protein